MEPRPVSPHQARRIRMIAVTVMVVFVVGTLGVLSLLAIANRSGGERTEQESPGAVEYPDAIVRRLDRMAREPRPVERSALPPRHLDAERFPVSLVQRDRIVSGGPPPDGIASIDSPRFEPVGAVDWIGATEPVLMLEIADRVRIHPLQIMMWHEIVNDVIDGIPVAVTYCPLCNTGVAIRREMNGGVLEFGVSGALYQSAMVMYDRQTESLWTHVDGRAVIGELVGSELEMLPVAVLDWDRARNLHAEAEVLSPPVAMPRYGQNPYGA